MNAVKALADVDSSQSDQLGPGIRKALWALRIFVVLLAILVTYTFIAQLTQ